MSQPKPSNALRVPAGRPIVNDEILDAEILDAEVVDAEILDAEILDAEILDAEVVEDQQIDVEVTVSSIPIIQDRLVMESPVVEDPWSDPRILPPEAPQSARLPAQVAQQSLPIAGPVVESLVINTQVFGTLDVVEAILVSPPTILDGLEPKLEVVEDPVVEDPWSDPRILPPDAPLVFLPSDEANQQSLPEAVFALGDLTSPVVAVSPSPEVVPTALGLGDLFPASEPPIMAGPIVNPEPNLLSPAPWGVASGTLPLTDPIKTSEPSALLPLAVDPKPQPTVEPAHTPTAPRFYEPVADLLSLNRTTSPPPDDRNAIDFEAPTVADGQNIFSRDLFRAALDLKPISGPTAPSALPEPNVDQFLLDTGTSPSTPPALDRNQVSLATDGNSTAPVTGDPPMPPMPADLPPIVSTEPSGLTVRVDLPIAPLAQNFAPPNSDKVGVSPGAGAAPHSPAVNEPPRLPIPTPFTPAPPIESRGPVLKAELPVAPPARNPASHSITKPAKNGRPAIRITFVRPGEMSPLDPPA